MSENIIRDDNGDLQKLTISDNASLKQPLPPNVKVVDDTTTGGAVDDKCRFCGSWSCGGDNCLNGLRNQLAEFKTLMGKQILQNGRLAEEKFALRAELAAAQEYIRCAIIVTPEEEQERQRLKTELAEANERIRQMQEYGCFVPDETGHKCQLALKLAEKDKEIERLIDIGRDAMCRRDSLRDELAEANERIRQMQEYGCFVPDETGHKCQLALKLAEKDKEIERLREALQDILDNDCETRCDCVKTIAKDVLKDINP